MDEQTHGRQFRNWNDAWHVRVIALYSYVLFDSADKFHLSNVIDATKNLTILLLILYIL